METIRIMETTIAFWVHIGIMEKKMEATLVYRGFPKMLPIDL